MSRALKVLKKQLSGSNGSSSKTGEENSASVPWIPKLHHKKGVAWLLKHSCAGLFLHPSMGKTSITLKAFSVLKKENIAARMLVIAPKRPCYFVWPREIEKWCEFNHLRYAILHGDRKDEALEQDADVYIINPDGLPWLTQENRWRKLRCDTLVVDESSKFKRTNTQRFKLLKPLIPSFSRRWILTGSPNPNGYLDLFGQVYILDLGNALGRFITQYKFNYFYPSGYGGYTWLLKPGSEKLIQQRIKPLVLFLDAGDYLDMPAVVEDNRRIDLPPKARKTYDEMEEELITNIGEDVVTAASVGAAMTKCAQIANGGIYTQEQERRTQGVRPWALMHNEKTEELVDLYEELQGSPLFVAYEFDHDVARIRAALGKDVPLMGEGSIKADDQIERDWNAGKIPLLLGHPASMGHGLNLQYGGCHHVCFYGLTYDFEQYDQTIRRFRREGNKHAEIFVHHIIARNTVDEAKLRALKSKDKTQRGLLDALKVYARERRR